MNLFGEEGRAEILLLEAGSKVWLQPRWMPQSEADAILKALEAEVRVEPARIRIFGREVLIPRLQAWHGDPAMGYRYSGVDLKPKPWTETLRRLVQRLESERPGLGFNSVLVNLYRDGADSVGWHADDEPELGPLPTIASLSFGATRRFRWKARGGGGAAGIDLHHGDLLWMEGRMQATHLHCAPRTAKAVGPRWNLTFRRVKRGSV